MKLKHLIIASSLTASTAIVSLFAMLPLSSKSATAKGCEWMKGVNDSVSLTSLSLPGSHDSGALHSIGDVSGKCQDLSVYDQLNCGVRFFDVRLQLRGSELKVVHGFVDQKLDFSSVLNDFDSFLKAHPSEGILVSVKKESDDEGSAMTFEESLMESLSKYSYWDESRTLPDSLGKLRGKAYLVSRYKNNSIGLPSYEGWIEHDEEDLSNTFDIEGSNLHVQDYFKIKDIENKKKEIISCLDYSQSNLDRLTLNFSSCYFLDSFPPSYAGSAAKLINAWLPEVIEERKNLGVIISDFVTSDFCEQIYSRNFA